MKKFVFVFVALMFVSCEKQGTYVPSENAKDDFHIEYLFECDGVKIYRFHDRGEIRYFATGNGRMTDSINKRTNGRQSIKYDDTVIQ